MLKAPPGLAQDLMENALPCQLWQSREAGSCLGGNRKFLLSPSTGTGKVGVWRGWL